MNKHDHRDSLLVPIILGRNRLRSAATGAMVSDDGHPQGPLAQLHDQLRREARAVGVDADGPYLAKAVAQMLRVYEQGYQDYLDNRDDELGFVLEAAFPSGRVLLMAEAPVLRRMGLLH